MIAVAFFTFLGVAAVSLESAGAALVFMGLAAVVARCLV